MIASNRQIRRAAVWGLVLSFAFLWTHDVAAQGQPGVAGTISVHQADAYVETVFSEAQEDAYAGAADIYLLLLGQVGEPLDESERAVVRRHVARMLLLLPEEVTAQVAEGNVRTLEGRLREHWTLKPGAGAVLTAWWRAQDSLPGTPRHERLEEHLQRAAVADRRYASRYSLTGWDDRGLIFVRLGEPSIRRSVMFSDPRLLSILEKTSIPIRLIDFPDNEVWLYDEFGTSAYYIFAKLDGFYTLGSSLDLIPKPLQLVSGRRTNLFVTKPPPEKTAVLFEALRAVYKELAPYHPDFGQAYLDIAEYVEVGEGTEWLERGFSTHKTPPHLIALSRISEVKAQETRETIRREETVPPQRSAVLDDVPLLPMAARWARFLDPDGTTRTEIYWSLPAQTLQTPDSPAYDRYLMQTTALQRAADYTPRVIDVHRQVVRAAGARDPQAVVPVQTLVLRGDTAVYHVHVQWDQYGLIGQGEATRKASTDPLQRGLFRADSLAALDARAGVLELSDPVPVTAAFVAGLDAFPQRRPPLQPYPFAVVTEQDSLGLYFEIYHLAFGADDQTHYEVAYEVTRRKGGLRGLLRGGKERIAARTSYTGRSRTAREAIVLVLDDWAEGEVDITIRVTDETTGQTVERSTYFVLATDAP